MPIKRCLQANELYSYERKNESSKIMPAHKGKRVFHKRNSAAIPFMTKHIKVYSTNLRNSKPIHKKKIFYSTKEGGAYARAASSWSSI